MKVNSLAFRLFATAAVWTLLVLPLLYRLAHRADSDEVPVQKAKVLVH